MDIIQVIITSVVSMVVLFILTKLIGNREMSQLSMFDYINSITIGSIAAELATALEEDFLKPLVAMIIYGVVTFLISFFTCKSIKLRRLFEGNAIVLYQNGQIYEKNLMKSKIDVDEFLEMCRTKDYFNLQDIHTALLEANGKLSIIPMAKERALTPADLKLEPSQEYMMANVVIDGKIIPNNLKSTGKNQSWVEKELKTHGVRDIKEVVLANYDMNENKLNVYIKLHCEKAEDIFE